MSKDYSACVHLCQQKTRGLPLSHEIILLLLKQDKMNSFNFKVCTSKTEHSHKKQVTHPHVVPNPHDLFSSAKHERRTLACNYNE